MNYNRKSSLSAALAAGIVGNAIWGASYLFTRIAQQEAPPMVQLSIRFIIAFIMLNLMLLLRLGSIRLRGKRYRALLLLSCLEPLYFFFESYGIYYSNSTFAGVALSVVPVLAIALGALVLKEYPSGKQILLCFIPIAGVVLVTVAGSDMGSVRLPGILLLLGACLCSAIYRVFNRSSAADFSAFERSYFVIGMCVIVFSAVALISVKGDLAPFVAAVTNRRFMMATMVLCVFCSVVANILANYSAGILPIAIFSNLSSVITVCAMFLGIIVLHEPANAMSLIGSAVVLVGIFLIARTK